MRRIPLEELKPGDIVGQPIYDEQGRILLKAGIAVSTRLIEKIETLQIQSVYIADSQEDIGSLHDVISPTIRHEAIKTVKRVYDSFVSEETIRNSQNLRKRSFSENEHIINLNSTVEAILLEVFSNKNAIVEMVDIKKMDNYLYEHAVNTAVLSLLIGLELQLSERDLRRLIVAALLMDVGNKLIDQSLFDITGPLKMDQYKQIQQHVRKGFDFIKDYSDVPVNVRNLILQHHERMNGSGYPMGLRGESIDPLARIIAIADTYDALTSDRPYRHAYPPSEALEKIMGDAGTLYDFKIVNLFAKRVLAFPNGTFVKLSNGDVGEVIASNKDIPLRPVVEILKHGNPEDDYLTLDLKHNLSVVIEHVVYRAE